MGLNRYFSAHLLGLKYLSSKKFKFNEIIHISYNKVYSHLKKTELGIKISQKILYFKFNTIFDKYQ